MKEHVASKVDIKKSLQDPFEEEYRFEMVNACEKKIEESGRTQNFQNSGLNQKDLIKMLAAKVAENEGRKWMQKLKNEAKIK